MASDELERDLTKSSVGYLSKEDYKRKREELEHEKAFQALKRMAGPPAGAPAAAAAAEGEAPSEGKKKKKKDKKPKPSALSFGDELEEEAEGASPVGGGLSAFRAREQQQAAERQEAAMREVLLQQQRARAEPLTLNYTFRSEVTQRELPGATHRGVIEVRRGFTADEVAVAVRTDVEKLGGKFAPNAVQGIKEERDVVLTCCCEGMPTGSFVIPGAVSLVELWTRRWCDQATPLFDEFKYGVVVTERRWYEAQRHVHPYSLWRLYESRADYSLKEWIANRNVAVNAVVARNESEAKREAAAGKRR